LVEAAIGFYSDPPMPAGVRCQYHYADVRKSIIMQTFVKASLCRRSQEGWLQG
jgi:hypothetical protein